MLKMKLDLVRAAPGDRRALAELKRRGARRSPGAARTRSIFIFNMPLAC